MDNLKLKNKNNEFFANLSLYYPILSPSICQKFNVQKIKTEKEILFDIINDLIDNFGRNSKKNNAFKTNDPSIIYNYIDNILNKKSDELKLLKIENIESRWDIIYNKVINIENETNEELIFYYITNDLLRNIKNNREPYEIISFLEEFMNLYNQLTYKDKLPKLTKKFLLLGLCNCENEYKNKDANKFLDIFKDILYYNDIDMNEKMIKKILDPNNIFKGKLHESILKFVKSKFAKSAFKKIFNMEYIPNDIEKEIFSNNIENYVCYFPYSSSSDTERTIKRFSLILINSNKNKNFINYKNYILDYLLYEFTNIVVRKYIFGHEHQHLSGDILYLTENLDRLSTLPYSIKDDKPKYDLSSSKNGERGELFEEMA